MELRQLRYFVAVAETLNFSRAAEALYISQSALSQQIAELEREMDVNLLLRSKRSVSLTDAGRTLLAEAKQLLYQSEKIVPLIRQTAGNGVAEEQKLFIGIDQSANLNFDSTFRLLLTDTICQMRQEMPGLRSVFSMYEQELLTRALDQGTVDVGFYHYYQDNIQGNNAFVSRVLLNDEMVLVLRSEQPLEDTPENVIRVLRERGLYLLEREMRGMSQILRIIDSLDVQPHIRFCGSRDAMILTAESGEGATVLPSSIARGLRDPNLSILHFRKPEVATYLLAVWKQDNTSPLISHFVDEMSRRFLMA